MLGLIIKYRFFDDVQEDEDCDYNHTLIDDSNAQGGDKENCSVARMLS